MNRRYISLKLTLPKKPGQYHVKAKLPSGTIVETTLGYVMVDDANMDFDTEELPDGSEVIAFCKIKD